MHGYTGLQTGRTVFEIHLQKSWHSAWTDAWVSDSSPNTASLIPVPLPTARNGQLHNVKNLQHDERVILTILASFTHWIQEVKLVGSKICVEKIHGEPSYAFGTACLTMECNKQTACWNVLSLVCTSENKCSYLTVYYQLTYRNSTCKSNHNNEIPYSGKIWRGF